MGEVDLPVRPAVAVVDDHVVFAEAVEVALRLAGLRVVPCPVGRDPEGAAALAHRLLGLDVGVVVLDLDLGAGLDGADLVAPLTDAGIGVLVLSGGVPDPVRWHRCQQLGAQAVLPKTRALREVTAAVERLVDGEPPVPRAELDAVARAAGLAAERHRLAHLPFGALTRREAEVLAELVCGRRVGEIARSRGASALTVRSQVKSVLGKLGVSSQLAAVSLARQAGWSGRDVDGEGAASTGP